MARAIFMFMHGDVAVDPSPEKAAGRMEAVDVEAGEYEAIYDDIGLVYEPIVENYRVRLIPTETAGLRGLGAAVDRLRVASGSGPSRERT